MYAGSCRWKMTVGMEFAIYMVFVISFFLSTYFARGNEQTFYMVDRLQTSLLEEYVRTHAYTHAERHADTCTDRQMDRQTCRYACIQTYGRTDIHMHMPVDSGID